MENCKKTAIIVWSIGLACSSLSLAADYMLKKNATLSVIGICTNLGLIVYGLKSV